MKQRTKAEWNAAGVDVGHEVDCSRIASGVVIHPGCRIAGADTSIGSGSLIGSEAPAIVENCQLGRGVKLKGGFFSGSVFFDGASIGSGSHVRDGTIMEEGASGAHSVGLKQTILFPFVTLGSLVNFCDVLMAGGTSRKNHSEVGSSYIHFNYTPHQDKATASLVGDVVHGVFLDRKPIFLGGQGGLVGPARIAYGSVVAAGGVCRQDILKENQLHIPVPPEPVTRSYETAIYGKISRIVANNLYYVGNVMALREWYRNVRSHFLRDGYDLAVLDGGVKNLGLILEERIKRLNGLAENLEQSSALLDAQGASAELVAEQKRFVAEWPQMRDRIGQLKFGGNSGFIKPLEDRARRGSYIETIQSLEPDVREAGRIWLRSIVDEVVKIGD